MTILVGYDSGDRYFIGADSRITWGPHRILDDYRKVRQWGKVTIATTGASRLDALMGATDLMPHDAVTAANTLRGMVRVDDWKPDGDDGPRNYHAEGLILDAVGLWLMACDFTVTRWPEGKPVFCGSGREYAAGAWETMTDGHVPAARVEHIIERAIILTCRLDQECGGAPTVVWRKRGETLE